MIGALLLSLSTLILLSVLGIILAAAILPNLNRLLLLPIAYPLGSGIYTWVLFVVSWAGVPINLTVAVVLLGLLLLGAWILLSRSRQRQSFAEVSGASSYLKFSSRDRAVLGTIVFALILLWTWTSWLAIGRSYGAWDSAAIWAAKGYGIALEGTLFMDWGAHGLSYPLNLPLQISLFELTGAELLPGAKLIFPLFYISVLGSILVFWLQNGVKVWLAGIGVLLIGTVPKIFEHAVIGYADLPQSAYLVMATLYGVEAIKRERRDASFILAGILLGLGAWTRPEGALYGVAVLAAFLLASSHSGLDWRRVARMAAWFALIVGPWAVFQRLYGAEGSTSMMALQQILVDFRSGQIDWYPIRLMFGFFRRQAIDTSVWGLLFYVCLILGVVNWRKLFFKAPQPAPTILLVGVSMASVTFILYFGISFVAPDFLGWMRASFARALFPAALSAGIVAVLIAGPINAASGESEFNGEMT